MIHAVPHTEYRMEFPDGEPMPMYMYYCLLGQEHEIVLNDGMGEVSQDALDAYTIALNGYPTQEDVCDGTRTFDVVYGVGESQQHARVVFYFDDMLYCNVQLGTKQYNGHVTYQTVHHFWWDCDTLDWYGLIDVKENADD